MGRIYYLATNSTRDQDVGLVPVGKCEGRPRQSVKVFPVKRIGERQSKKYSNNIADVKKPKTGYPMRRFLLQFFVFVLHENSSSVDIHDADTVTATGGDFGCGFGRVFGIRLENNFPYLKRDIQAQCNLNLSRISICQKLLNNGPVRDSSESHVFSRLGNF